MGGDIEHWKRCLVSSIQLFCRNFCQYDSEAKIDGLLAITLDKKEVILVTLQETECNGTSEKVNQPNHPSKEQSEQLESILRYLAPSCRLLKKAPVKATTLPVIPPVWQPVTESNSSTMPDRCTFLRSLGLVPTQPKLVVPSCSAAGSCVTRLQMNSSTKSFTRDGESLSESCKFHSEVDCGNSTDLATIKVKKVKTDECKKDNHSRVDFGKQTMKNKPSIVKMDANGNEKLLGNVCNRSSGAKLKSSLTSSHAVNCNTDVRVCLDLKSVSLLLREQKKLKVSKIVNNSVLKKPAKLLRKRSISTSASVTNSSAKVSLDTGKKRSKSEMGAIERTTSEATTSIRNTQKRKFKKQKVSKVKELACHALCKKSCSSANDRDEECSNSKTAIKSGSKRKASTNLSTLLAGDLKKKIASKKLLNKTKATRLKVLYGKKKGHRSLESELEKRTKGCGTCSGCRTKENCTVCTYCKDMKQYGGPNKMHKKCQLRQCRSKTKKAKKSSSKADSSQNTNKELESSLAD